MTEKLTFCKEMLIATLALPLFVVLLAIGLAVLGLLCCIIPILIMRDLLFKEEP